MKQTLLENAADFEHLRIVHKLNFADIKSIDIKFDTELNKLFFEIKIFSIFKLLKFKCSTYFTFDYVCPTILIQYFYIEDIFIGNLRTQNEFKLN